MLILAEHLRQMPVEDKDGNVVYKEIGRIEVAVSPDSNFPNKDSATVNALAKLSSMVDETGAPIIPSTMLVDAVSKMYPGLAVGGKYRRDLELIKIGKQALMQQQQAQEQNAIAQEKQTKPIEDVQRKITNALTSAAAEKILNKKEGNENG
jgi:hypothetical protein